MAAGLDTTYEVERIDEGDDLERSHVTITQTRHGFTVHAVRMVTPRADAAVGALVFCSPVVRLVTLNHDPARHLLTFTAVPGEGRNLAECANVLGTSEAVRVSLTETQPDRLALEVTYR